jgi:hypothetical protein
MCYSNWTKIKLNGVNIECYNYVYRIGYVEGFTSAACKYEVLKVSTQM